MAETLLMQSAEDVSINRTADIVLNGMERHSLSPPYLVCFHAEDGKIQAQYSCVDSIQQYLDKTKFMFQIYKYTMARTKFVRRQPATSAGLPLARFPGKDPTSSSSSQGEPPEEWRKKKKSRRSRSSSSSSNEGPR